uniref:medium-chain acyl-CoA ligase n=1 Tax=Coremiostelium polycephalum TaxID=142831 RepID=A0A1L2FUM1_9MYCE|nr:putative acetyl-CoA synthetase [Coremiostelium polycephalum]
MSLSKLSNSILTKRQTSSILLQWVNQQQNYYNNSKYFQSSISKNINNNICNIQKSSYCTSTVTTSTINSTTINNIFKQDDNLKTNNNTENDDVENTNPIEYRDPLKHNMVNIKSKSYKEIYDDFKWDIPKHFNIGGEICDKHVENGNDLYNESNKLANALKELGIKKGDRVGVLLSQGFETAVSHCAILKYGGITIPLFTLFGPEALEYRLSNAEASCVLTDSDNLPKLKKILPLLPNLKKIIVFNQDKDEQTTTSTKKKGSRKSSLNFFEDEYLNISCIEYWNEIKSKYSSEFKTVNTKSDDPALIIFTSGTTGNPKGCLHAHRVLIGHLPGVQLPQNLFPQQDRKLLFYTPADWAWIGGLIDVLFPSLFYGVPVLAHRAQKFDPIKIASLMERHSVTTCFLPPTSIKMMRQSKLPTNHKIASIGSGGESLGDQLLEWGKETFGTTINEFYGQTEANLIVGNCSAIMDVKPGSMGRPIPGHKVDIIDENGNTLPTGSIGNIALKKPDPVIFLRYWKNEKATKKKYINDWLVTGDLGKKDSDGYIWYSSRDDDLINSSGYRIGPGEIEHCLLRHKAVALSGVIGVPDEIRGEIVKAYIVLKPGVEPTEELKLEIQNFVKTQLAAHEYPRLIEFIESLPMTTTGKIMRKDLREKHQKDHGTKTK